jgi:hypothetical protein
MTCRIWSTGSGCGQRATCQRRRTRPYQRRRVTRRSRDLARRRGSRRGLLRRQLMGTCHRVYRRQGACCAAEQCRQPGQRARAACPLPRRGAAARDRPGRRLARPDRRDAHRGHLLTAAVEVTPARSTARQLPPIPATPAPHGCSMAYLRPTVGSRTSLRSGWPGRQACWLAGLHREGHLAGPDGHVVAQPWPAQPGAPPPSRPGRRASRYGSRRLSPCLRPGPVCWGSSAGRRQSMATPASASPGATRSPGTSGRESRCTRHRSVNAQGWSSPPSMIRPPGRGTTSRSISFTSRDGGLVPRWGRCGRGCGRLGSCAAGGQAEGPRPAPVGGPGAGSRSGSSGSGQGRAGPGSRPPSPRKRGTVGPPRQGSGARPRSALAPEPLQFPRSAMPTDPRRRVDARSWWDGKG